MPRAYVWVMSHMSHFTHKNKSYWFGSCFTYQRVMRTDHVRHGDMGHVHDESDESSSLGWRLVSQRAGLLVDTVHHDMGADAPYHWAMQSQHENSTTHEPSRASTRIQIWTEAVYWPPFFLKQSPHGHGWWSESGTSTQITRWTDGQSSGAYNTTASWCLQCAYNTTASWSVWTRHMGTRNKCTYWSKRPKHSHRQGGTGSPRRCRRAQDRDQGRKLDAVSTLDAVCLQAQITHVARPAHAPDGWAHTHARKHAHAQRCTTWNTQPHTHTWDKCTHTHTSDNGVHVCQTLIWESYVWVERINRFISQRGLLQCIYIFRMSLVTHEFS